MLIRPATLADGGRVCEMAARFMDSTVYGKLIAWEPGPLADLVYAILHDGRIFVAEVERAAWTGNGDREPPATASTLVGMMALILRQHPMNASIYCDEIAWWVEPEHRGGSVAYRLWTAGEQWARENGASVLKMVAPAETSLGTHYERRGYVLVESIFQKTL